MEFYGFEKLSLVDFDTHMACTVFTGGCNFLCPFCHNATLVLDPKSQKVFTEDFVLEYLEKRKGVIDAIVITGGEPTLHKSLPEFIKKVKAKGVLVKLDTNGSNPEMLKSLVENKLIDYVAMDIKTAFPLYPIVIGIDGYNTKKIEESAEFLLTNKIPFEFRTTVLNGMHTEEDFEYIAKTLKGTKRYFIQKFTDQGNCIEKGFSPVPKETAEKFKEILSKTMENVSLRGYD